MQGWGEKLPSEAGKKIFIKAVVQSILCYTVYFQIISKTEPITYIPDGKILVVQTGRCLVFPLFTLGKVMQIESFGWTRILIIGIFQPTHVGKTSMAIAPQPDDIFGWSYQLFFFFFFGFSVSFFSIFFSLFSSTSIYIPMRNGNRVGRINLETKRRKRKQNFNSKTKNFQMEEKHKFKSEMNFIFLN